MRLGGILATTLLAAGVILVWTRGAVPVASVRPERLSDFHATNPALFSAIWRGDFDGARHCLEAGASAESVVREEDGDSSTALEAASAKGDVAIVRLLLQHGAEINATDAQGGTAVLAAIEAGRSEALRFLVDHGATLTRGAKQNALGYVDARAKDARDPAETKRFRRVAQILGNIMGTD